MHLKQSYVPVSWSFLGAAAIHNAVPIGLGISIASSISSRGATSTHLLTTDTFHADTHMCNGLQHKKKVLWKLIKLKENSPLISAWDAIIINSKTEEIKLDSGYVCVTSVEAFLSFFLTEVVKHQTVGRATMAKKQFLFRGFSAYTCP